MMNKEEKKILKIILKNKLTINTEHSSADGLVKETKMDKKDIYKIIQLLLTKKYIEIINTGEFWMNRELRITEKGLNALSFNWRSLIRDTLIAVATIVSIIALLYAPAD